MSIITLTTDFGEGSPYVAEMKGAMLSVSRSLQIVDATHSISPQNVLQGALALRQYCSAFPAGTVHVAVVDPGVGTDRKVLLVRCDGHFYIAPDNGLLTFQLDRAADVFQVDQPGFWRTNVSTTFHGRDIMGPVAAWLCSGKTPAMLATPCTSAPVVLQLPELSVSRAEIRGEVLCVDTFGNLITNVSRDDLADLTGRLEVTIGNRQIDIVETYLDSERGTLVALCGSSGWLEVAVCCGNASDFLHVGPGQCVRVRASS